MGCSLFVSYGINLFSCVWGTDWLYRRLPMLNWKYDMWGVGRVEGPCLPVRFIIYVIPGVIGVNDLFTLHLSQLGILWMLIRFEVIESKEMLSQNLNQRSISLLLLSLQIFLYNTSPPVLCLPYTCRYYIQFRQINSVGEFFLKNIVQRFQEPTLLPGIQQCL